MQLVNQLSFAPNLNLLSKKQSSLLEKLILLPDYKIYLKNLIKIKRE